MSDSGVEFDDSSSQDLQFTSRKILGQPETPGMVRWLNSHGVKSEKTAGYVLITITICSFAAAIIITLYALGIIHLPRHATPLNPANLPPGFTMPGSSPSGH